MIQNNLLLCNKQATHELSCTANLQQAHKMSLQYLGSTNFLNGCATITGCKNGRMLCTTLYLASIQTLCDIYHITWKQLACSMALQKERDFQRFVMTIPTVSDRKSKLVVFQLIWALICCSYCPVYFWHLSQHIKGCLLQTLAPLCLRALLRTGSVSVGS